LRYVPDAVKDEFVNIGVVLVESGASEPLFGDVRFTRDWRRVKCLDPEADIEMLEALEQDLRARLAEAAGRERILHVLKDSFSGSLQLSPGKACLADSPQEELGKLAAMYLEPRPREGEAREAAGRQFIVNRMRDAFERAGVWNLPQMRKRIAVAQYTRAGDPLKIDCGYRPNGVVKLFHAVSLASDVNSAKVLAFTYPQIAEGIARLEKATAELTAVVEDDLDRQDEPIAFALETLKQSRITVSPIGELTTIAEAIRRELRV
ncbi:MAG: DUF3037 domain-containing protein, partial [Terriglobales bacterium]